MSLTRSTWTDLTDERLLAQCEVDTYRASGPGGQKRNKTSSAVRLRHPPTSLLVIAEESRSQHENKAKALIRIRKALYLELRDAIDLATAAQRPGWTEALTAAGRLDMGKRDPRFWPAVGVALDVLVAVEGRVSDAAAALGVTTGNLVGFLEEDPKVWQQANVVRARFGQKSLKT